MLTIEKQQIDRTRNQPFSMSEKRPLPLQAKTPKESGAAHLKLPPNRLDFIRFALASLVIYSHSYPIATGTEEFEPFSIFAHHQMTFGVAAVDCFFIISGFLILQSWLQRPDAKAFLWKRVSRIYPGFIVAASIGALVLTPLTSKEGFSALTPEFVVPYLLNLLRLHDTPPGGAFWGNPAQGPVNGSLWSIPFEFWCYIGVLALGMMKLTSKKCLILVGLMISVAVSFIFVFFNLRPGGKILGLIFGYPPFWARMLPYFLVGMVFCLFRENIRLHWIGAVISLSAIAVAAKLSNGLLFVLPFAGSYLLFWFAFIPKPFLRNFGRYGDFSYGIYLYSFPILQLIVWVHGRAMSPWALFLLAWPLSIAVGALSWHGLEKFWVRNAATSAIPLPAAMSAAVRD